MPGLIVTRQRASKAWHRNCFGIPSKRRLQNSPQQFGVMRSPRYPAVQCGLSKPYTFVEAQTRLIASFAGKPVV
eukprot:11617599-Prorocentrum_lima.AAC.1